MTIEVTDANFEEVVLQSDKPVLVDFWAEWCGPCRMIGPLVSELSDDYKDRAVIAKMDVDSNPGTQPNLEFAIYRLFFSLKAVKLPTNRLVQCRKPFLLQKLMLFCSSFKTNYRKGPELRAFFVFGMDVP